MKDPKKSSDVPTSTSNQPTTSGESMFIKQNDPIPRSNKLFDFDAGSQHGGSDESGTRSQYRTNYPINFDPHLLEDKFFKSLEG